MPSAAIQMVTIPASAVKAFMVTATHAPHATETRSIVLVTQVSLETAAPVRASTNAAMTSAIIATKMRRVVRHRALLHVLAMLVSEETGEHALILMNVVQ